MDFDNSFRFFRESDYGFFADVLFGRNTAMGSDFGGYSVASAGNRQPEKRGRVDHATICTEGGVSGVLLLSVEKRG